MKQIIRLLALSALVLLALFAARTLALPSNELTIAFPESGTESSLSGEAERPAAPVLTAAPGLSLVTISWQPVTGAVSYELWLRYDDTTWQQPDGGSLTDTSFNHTGFTSGETYFYTGRSVSASGKKSPWAPQVQATVTDILAAPDLTATPGDRQIELSWQPVTGADSYQIRAWDSVTEWHRLDHGVLTGTSFPHTGLTAGRTYYYWIRALTAAGAQGPWSQRIDATAKAGLTAPVLTATPGLSLVTISWQPVEDAATYELWVREGANPQQQLDDGALTGTTFTHTGFTSAGTYSYTGRTVTAAGKKSPWAPQVDAALTEILAVPELTATPDDVRIELSWQPVTAADSYEIRVYDSVTHWDRLDDGALTSTSFPHTGLTTGRTYYYWVRARTAAGAQGPWSERIPAPALAAPALTATPEAGQVTLTWQQVAGADSYEIQVWDSVNGWDQIDDGALTGTSFPHTGLTTGRTYYYWVRAISAEGAGGPWSERVDATP